MKRIVLGVQYDGSPWQGWQTQPNGRTVQDSLQAAIKKFSNEDISVTCAGRTDAGVHALEQVVHFDTSVQRENYSWIRGMNSYLPPSIAVRWAHELPLSADGEQFHARYSAIGRTYRYFLYNHPVRSPLLASKVGWVFRTLDVESMRVAANHLIGKHDFSAFRALECQSPSPIRSIYQIDIQKHGDLIIFTLNANAFLHHMVRNIVGSLIYVGNGSRSSEWIAQLLDSRNRSLAAPTFMPDGLYLAKVDYDKKWGLPQQPLSIFG